MGIPHEDWSGRVSHITRRRGKWGRTDSEGGWNPDILLLLDFGTERRPGGMCWDPWSN